MLWWLLACERPLIGFTGIPPALCFPVWDSVLGMRMPFSWSLGCRCCEDMTFNMDIDPAAELLERVQMKYIEDYEGITKYFAAFHLYKSFPTAIIIDDFGDLFIDRSCQHKYGNARGRDLAMARTMALCQDAIAYANQKQQAQRLCNLLLADTHQGDSPRLLFIYKRWVQCILTIQGDISGSFILKYSSISGNHLAKTRTAKYSIALQSLLLEDFES
ncbi:hypothetical protein MUK42_24337 [Musa troglodytarum]|uniref:Uncharacterized protein n=1 Tax=Musa troglodytarum TaxID=320322 RepID=A0A9E7EZ02_9LILI|nr:hypothetical protein MUK42_24337 [Musa troglodytarum]